MSARAKAGKIVPAMQFIWGARITMAQPVLMMCSTCLQLYCVTFLDADDSYLVEVPPDDLARQHYSGSGFVQVSTAGPFCLDWICAGDLTFNAEMAGWPHG